MFNRIVYYKYIILKIIYKKIEFIQKSIIRKKYCMCKVPFILFYSNVKHNDTDHAIASFSANFCFSICVNMNYIS